MSLYLRVLADLKAKRLRVLNGETNCIPSPFPRFRGTYVGLEQAKYLLVTASTKIGKTQIGDFLFLYTPLLYAFNNPHKIRLKIFYFSLEMSKMEKYRQFMSFLLYIVNKGKVRIDTKHLRSINEEFPLPEDVLNLLESEKYVKLYEFFEKSVEIIDSIRNPTGIYKYCQEYSAQNGVQHYKTMDIKNSSGEVIDTRNVKDYYVQNDPEEYRIVIVDHYKLFTTEKGKDLYSTILDWSSNYAIKLRNNDNFTVIGVQQQAPSQESNENYKLNKLKPTLDGLGDCKATAQDADLILGLYSPFRYGIREYEGYDITKFRDHIRFLEVLGGREGGGGDICPLYFDGAVNYFKELPFPTDKANLQVVYKMVEEIYNPRQGILNLTIADLNESINSSKKRFWEINQYWGNSRIRNKRTKS